jgi:hypothetical protein
VGMNTPSSSQGQRFMDIPQFADVNINGEVRDQDTFILGSDDEEEANEEERPEYRGAGPASMSSPLPPLYESIVDPWKEESPPHKGAILASDSTCLAEESSQESLEPDSTRPYKYYINRSDTLQGLSLRLGIDVSTIIRPLF